MRYMAQPGAPPAAWQGPSFKENQTKTNSTIRLEHRNSDTPFFASDARPPPWTTLHRCRPAGLHLSKPIRRSDNRSRLYRRYMQLEGLQTLSNTVPTRLSAVAR